MNGWIVVLAGALGLTGVAMGAYAAHGLESSLSKQGVPAEEIEKRIDQCDIGVRYHMTHSLGLLVLGLATDRIHRRVRNLAASFWLGGIALFCGGLYSMAVLDQIGHWAIVPSGGLLFMIGWVWILVLGMTQKQRD